MGKSAAKLCVSDLDIKGGCDVSGSMYAYLQQKP